MIGFWIAAGLLAAASAVLVLHRARAAAAAAPEDPTLAVYRRQLTEIDDLAGRGLLAEPERKSAHAEAGRRLLTAADNLGGAWSTGAPKAALLSAASAGPLLAFGLYFAVGSPGLGDQPIAARVADWRASDPRGLEAPQIAAVLRQVVAEHPGDPEALQFLAIAEAQAGDAAGAVRTLRRAISLAPDQATLWSSLGEALLRQAGGELTPPAREAFEQALRRDPKAIVPRFFLAKAQVDGGDRRVGLAVWRGLLAELPADDPRRRTIAIALAEAEGAPPGADQAAMIRGMVDGLAARLEQAPDDPQGWARLVRSYAVLGDTAERDRALAAARARYRDRPEILQALAEAAAAEPMR